MNDKELWELMSVICEGQDSEQRRKVEQYITDLQQENKQLKANWNKLKEYIDIKLYNTKYLQKLCGCRIYDETHMILDILIKEMQELEKGSD